MIRTYLLPLVAAGALMSMVWHVGSTHEPATDVPPPIVPARTIFSGGVAASGVVEPARENVHLSTEVAGVVAAVLVTEGQAVAEGGIVLRLDDRWKQSELAVQRAVLAASEQEMERLRSLPRPEDIPPSEARVRREQAAVDAHRDQFNRAGELFKRQVVTDQEIVQKRMALAVSQAELDQASTEDRQLKMGSWDKEIAVAAAAVEQARRRVAQGQVEIDRLAVRAPLAGTILRVDVRAWYVGTPPGKSLVVLGDTTRAHVRVSIDEHDICRFRPGMPAIAHVRGDTSRPLALPFGRVVPFVEPKRMLTGQGDERVDTRVLQVIFRVTPSATESPETDLYMGQQVDVRIEPPPQVDGAMEKG
ncbi:MAG: biotin/lipoyl-binding protein [Planctomycetes bacterium]|nr:biotin/lipoyl-binding protein [Planctomycetota bacterium]